MSLGAGPRGLALTVEDSLRGALLLGVLEAEGIRPVALGADWEADRDAVVTRLATQYAGRASAELPGVAETRTLFHRLDIDPTKTRPSSEALLRRVLQGKGLPVVNPVVDVCNLCSLEHQIPLGLYDRDLVRGELQVRAGRPGEGYAGIRKGRVNLGGRLLLSDDDGPFGAPTSDSLRTSVSAHTVNLLVVLFCPVERTARDLSAALEQIAQRLARYCRAEVVAVRTLQ
jgi:DNA/RNA-binding domain of Phe-tRNA-synthetase-like protein